MVEFRVKLCADLMWFDSLEGFFSKYQKFLLFQWVNFICMPVSRWIWCENCIQNIWQHLFSYIICIDGTRCPFKMQASNAFLHFPFKKRQALMTNNELNHWMDLELSLFVWNVYLLTCRINDIARRIQSMFGRNLILILSVWQFVSCP